MSIVRISDLPLKRPTDVDIVPVMGADGTVYGVEYRYLKPIEPTPSVSSGMFEVTKSQRNNNEENPSFNEGAATVTLSVNNEVVARYEIRDI